MGEPKRVEAVAVADEPAQQRAVQRPAAEPHAAAPRAGTASARGTRRGTRKCVPSNDGGRVAPGALHRRELLVEDRAALAERHAERLVLVRVPATPSAARRGGPRRAGRASPARFASSSGWRSGAITAAGDEAQLRGRGGDRAQQHDRVGQGVAGSWLPGSRVVARVRHHARPRPAIGPSTTCSLEHHRVDARVLGLDRHAHEGAEVARRDERPVLAEDEHELHGRHDRVGCQHGPRPHDTTRAGSRSRRSGAGGERAGPLLARAGFSEPSRARG